MAEVGVVLPVTEFNFQSAPESLPTIAGTQVYFHEQLREAISKGSLDFDTWTSLISEIEKTYPDNIETISLVYDYFLSKFPLCFGYWRKYADHHARLCTVEKVVEIFERAVQSATYSVDLWVEYFSFSMSAFEDPCSVRRIFRRGMSFIGKDYLCHALWDKYLEFEFSKQQWSFIAHVYIQALRSPTKKLHRYYNDFCKFTAILREEVERQNHCSNDPDSESFTCKDPITPKDEILCVIQDLLDPKISPRRSKALQKYISIGEQFYREACRLEEKIHCFETKIKRPYFHVKPLDEGQIENWHRYLDFVESQQDFDWVVKLYERCLIPCANYPEFWMRYVELMESKGGREIANFALDRASQIFLKNVPAIHLFNARYKEHIGDVFGARAAFLLSDSEFDSCFIDNVVKEANMEKRMGNFGAASDVYERAFVMAEERQKLHTVSSLYIHFSRLKYKITGSEDAALDVIIDGLRNVPHCKLLLEGLINFAMTHGGSRQINLLDSIVVNEISPGPDLSKGLSTEDREVISLLYLEFVDYCGTIHDLRKAWDRHLKLFPHSLRTTSSGIPTSVYQLLNVAAEGRQSNPSGLPGQPSDAHISGHPAQLPLEEQRLSFSEIQGIQPDHVFSDKFQPKDVETGADGNVQQLSSNVVEHVREESMEVNELIHEFMEQSGPDASKPMESVVASVHQLGDDGNGPVESTPDILHQPREVASGICESIHDSERQVINDIGSSEASKERSDSVDVKHEFSDTVSVKQGQDYEFEQHHELPSIETLSLSPQNKESWDSMTRASYGCEARQATSSSDGMRESCPNTDGNPSVASRKSSPHTDFPQIQKEIDEDDSMSLSCTPSDKNPKPAEVDTQPQQLVPSNSGGNWYEENNSATPSKDELLQVSCQQPCPSLEMDAQKLNIQGYPHDHSTSQNPQAKQDDQVHGHYQVGEAQENLVANLSWSTQNLQLQNAVNISQPKLSSLPVSQPQGQISPHPVQSSEVLESQHSSQAQLSPHPVSAILGDQQSSQPHNQPLQYCYYQQQPQLQQHYLQQQQQQPYQQLQPQQDPQQLYLFQQQQYLQYQQQQQQQPQQEQNLVYQQQQQQYQQLQQMQQQQGQQMWQHVLQQHQQQQYHHYQQWQQYQQGYQHLLQQHQEYQQRLQQTQMQPQEEYQKLQQTAQQQQQQGYYYQLQQQQHDGQQLPQSQIISTQIQTWNGNYYQQDQVVAPLHGTGAVGQQQSPQALTPQCSAGTSAPVPAISPRHQQHSPHGLTLPDNAGASEPAVSPHLNTESRQTQ